MSIVTPGEVRSLLAEFGRAVTFRKYSTDPDDADRPESGPSTDDDDMTEVEGYMVQAQGPPGRLDRIIDSSNELGVMTVYASIVDDGEEVDLESFDEMHDGDDVWRVSSIRRTSPGAVNLLYEIRVSR